MKNKYADKGFAPIYAGHESAVLLLHQPALQMLHKPSASIALTSTDYKTVAFLLC